MGSPPEAIAHSAAVRHSAFIWKGSFTPAAHAVIDTGSKPEFTAQPGIPAPG
jgi:hypothetical protein